ncbi:hypothetical protein [Fibrivirga algicola]|uniref:Uncharacterized protein n=1 Tax=Fibrivirga algicola TaxID=2950420 RepID=A0ABX0QAZ1_9BACT|nr:hypothetical protein [Fibrivirga algicola]NID09461.1 hypothetical protein [Fibrivirga algicola]
MNTLNAKTTWTNAELVPLKIAIGSFYLFVGTYFHAYLEDYYRLMLLVFGITVVWSVLMWVSKMRRENDTKKAAEAV